MKFEAGLTAVRTFAKKVKRTGANLLASVDDAFAIEYYRTVLENLNESIGDTRVEVSRCRNADQKQMLSERLGRMLSQRVEVDARVEEITARVASRQSARQGRED